MKFNKVAVSGKIDPNRSLKVKNHLEKQKKICLGLDLQLVILWDYFQLIIDFQQKHRFWSILDLGIFELLEKLLVYIKTINLKTCHEY